MAALAWLLTLTLRSTVVLAVALVLGALLRRAPALARHRLLTLTAVGLLLLPALPVVLPRWELRFMAPWTETPSEKTRVRPTARASGAGSPADGPVSPKPERPVSDGRVAEASSRRTRVAAAFGSAETLGSSLGPLAAGVWLIGALASLIGLGRALRRERRVLAAARPLVGPWLETLDEAQRVLALRRPVRLLTSDEIETPLTGGWRRPAVLLPPTAALWPDERRRVVVQHELVHVQRSDPLRHLAWRLVVALYWFHPLARRAERQASVVGEQACDEAVLDLGTRPSVYARHLLEIAESLRARPLRFANALSMIDRSQLERRLLMILDPNRAAGRGRAMAALSLALLAATVLGVGAAMPTPLASSSHAVAAAPQPKPPQKAFREAGGTACLEGIDGSFSGTVRDSASGTDLIGDHDGDFSLQHGLGGGRRLCARVHGPVRFDERNGSIRELPPGSSVLVETRKGRTGSRRMLVTAEQGEPRYQWWLDGAPQTPDAAARAWLADALEVVAAFRAIGSIQGQVGTLQGEIGTIQGEVGTLQGQIGTIQGQEGSLQGRIGSIQGELGTLQGVIGTHQGAIGSLQGARWRASEAQQARIEREIKEHEAAIKEVEAQIATGTLARRMVEAEARLRAFEQEARGRIAELEKRIKDVRLEERTSTIQQQIEALHAEERIQEIELRMKPALERLKDQIE